MKPRYFTVEMANRTVPLVQRIVSDVMSTYREIQACQKRLDRAGEGASDGAMARLETRMQRLLGELNSIGCVLKDFETGLLDFHARNGDKVILLCWRSGEESVEYWHDLHAGVAGRRSVAELPPETRFEPVASPRSEA